MHVWVGDGCVFATVGVKNKNFTSSKRYPFEVERPFCFVAVATKRAIYQIRCSWIQFMRMTLACE